jgi:hypothetical protein
MPIKHEDDQYLRIFQPGVFWGILGRPRTGKSTVLMMIAQAALNHGWVVFSNVMLHKWNPKRERFVQDTVPNYHYVNTWGQLFALLPKYVGRVYDREAGKATMKSRILLAIDEAMMTDLGGGRTLQSSKPRSAVGMAAQAAKLGITIVIVAHSAKMLTSSMRTSGLLFGYIRKIRYGVYSAQEIARFEVPDPDIVDFDPEKMDHYKKYWLKVMPTGIAQAQEMIESPEGGYDPSQVIYISETPATMTTGAYPEPFSKIPFDMDHMLEVLSAVEPEDVAMAIANEMASPPRPGAKGIPRKDSEDSPEPDERESKPASEHSGEERTGEIKTTIINLLRVTRSPTKVIDQVGKERKSQVYKYWKMIESGQI